MIYADPPSPTDAPDAWPGVAAFPAVEPPPWLRVETTLMATARAIRVAFDARLAPLDLNLTQATMLAFVDEYGPVTQTQIADRNGIGRAATGAAVDRLESRGLVERRPDPADRRVWLVAITPVGVDLARQVAAIDRVLQHELRTGITRDERNALATVMTRIQANVAAALATAPAATTPSPVTEKPGAPPT
jgi:DNA-binding MarR family transcriptional regulator